MSNQCIHLHAEERQGLIDHRQRGVFISRVPSTGFERALLDEAGVPHLEEYVAVHEWQKIKKTNPRIHLLTKILSKIVLLKVQNQCMEMRENLQCEARIRGSQSR